MLLKKGNALENKNLSNFLRMLNVSIPQGSFDNIDSDGVIKTTSTSNEQGEKVGTNEKITEEKFEKKGLIFSGLSPDSKLPEIVELKNHPWFIGVQFHPEFKSRPFAPHPLFSSFIKASKNHK